MTPDDYPATRATRRAVCARPQTPPGQPRAQRRHVEAVQDGGGPRPYLDRYGSDQASEGSPIPIGVGLPRSLHAGSSCGIPTVHPRWGLERGANTAQTEWGRGVYLDAYYGTGLSYRDSGFWLSIVNAMD